MYEAVNAIEQTHVPYVVQLPAPRWASAEAAAATAAHDTLVGLYPAYQKRLDAQLEESLTPISDGAAKRWGIRVGQAAAQVMLAIRAHDGSDAGPLPYTPGTNPGDYQLTPPSYSAPVNTHWQYITPYTLASADQFRPGPPPALTSTDYAAAFNEVKEIGAVDSATRTDEQTFIARFWYGRPEIDWNRVAQDVAEAQGTSLAENARLFALLNFAMGDAAVGLADAKYTYNFWRPVTSIPAADTDENPDTEPDPDWLPLLATPAHPSYLSAHSSYASAAAAVMALHFGTDDIPITVRSNALPGETRSFPSFSAAVTESSASRIYAGLHYRFDVDAGTELGTAIGTHAFQNFLLPRTGPGGGAPSGGDRLAGDAVAAPAVVAALQAGLGGVRVRPIVSWKEPATATGRDLASLHPVGRPGPFAAECVENRRKMVSQLPGPRVDLVPGSAMSVSLWTATTVCQSL